jgi:GTPase
LPSKLRRRRLWLDNSNQDSAAMIDNTADNGDPPAGSAKRCGFVAIVGAPNSGKSTLVNALVGHKVTIVSHKVQTTRAPLRGIAIEGQAQLILIDTPGIFRPKRRLDRAMVDAAVGGAAGADMVVLLFDASKVLEGELDPVREKMAAVTVPFVVALNKIDKVKSKADLLTLAQNLTETEKADQVFMISALSGDGVDDLKRYLAEKAPLGPWHFPADEISDAPARILAAELTREKIYTFLHQELPYATTVETTDWKELKDGSVRIEQTIYVERDSQRKIVLGKGGQSIKKISSTSRQDLSKILDRKVHLFLFVKVRENWGSDPERYREMGLEFPSDD